MSNENNESSSMKNDTSSQFQFTSPKKAVHFTKIKSITDNRRFSKRKSISNSQEETNKDELLNRYQFHMLHHNTKSLEELSNNNNINNNQSQKIKKLKSKKSVTSFLPKVKPKNKHSSLHKTRKSLSQTNLINKSTVNFKKMLSRAYIDKITSIKEHIHSILTPNYNAIEPKCIMKVTYTKKIYNENKPPFKGMSADYTFDMNKLFYKYNNHIPPKTFRFKSFLEGRINSNLPLFMVGQYDRNSCETFNDKNLKMNCYANGNLRESRSCFNDKKSFNRKIDGGIDEKEELEKQKISSLMKKAIEDAVGNKNTSSTFSNKFRMKTMYKNFFNEYNRNKANGEIIDGITLKNFKIVNLNRGKYD